MTGKNIIVEIEDGYVVGVYCPDNSYDVHILDHDDWNENNTNPLISLEVDEYYSDLDSLKTELVERIEYKEEV